MAFTYAVLGRDEAELLPNALRQALAAARPGDQVVFVDSASSDESAAVAAGLGVRRVDAPAGKGRAVALVLDTATTDHVVFVDADIENSERNIPAALRHAAERSGADLVVGDIDWAERPMLNSANVYRPLVGALFPEVLEPVGGFPFSGFRVLRTAFDWGPIPPGFGVDAHLNVTAAARGGRIVSEPLGRYWGPVRPKRLLGREVGAAILDAAVADGRLSRGCRAQWDAWVEHVVESIAAGDADGAAAAARLRLPPRGIESAGSP